MAAFKYNLEAGMCKECCTILEINRNQKQKKERDVYVTLEDLYNGCTKRIEMSRKVIDQDGETSEFINKIFTFTVKPGWREGMRVTFPKQVERRSRITREDTVFVIRQKPHSRFTRQNDDLHYTADISLEEALTGVSLEIETLDGRFLSIPINDIIHPDYTTVFPGEGMPQVNNPSKRGNLIIHFTTHFPPELSAERKRVIKKALSPDQSLPYYCYYFNKYRWKNS